MKVLVLNAGSSTLKFGLIESEGEHVLAEGVADWSAAPARLTVRRPGRPEARSGLDVRHHGDAVGRVLDELKHEGRAEVAAVGHRVVHGGDVYTASVRVTDEVKRTVAALAELAPLHNPANLEGITAAEAALPGVPQVAVFDTAFHATLPEAARVYPLPYAWHRDWGLRRYGFHGLSHAYCAGRAAEMLGSSSPRPRFGGEGSGERGSLFPPRPHRNGGEGLGERGPGAGLRLVICHLGNGCSASAVRGGVCVDTSMGFTPLDGLMMGTRSGSVDPGLLLHVLRRRGVTAEELDDVLNHRAGLLGVSGVSSDMRQVLAAARAGHAQARLALEVYAHRIRQTVGAMAATLGGVDALVFTAGVGENAAEVRAAACAGLECLGLELDAEGNANRKPDADVAAASSPGRILVIGTREDLVIVRETVQVVKERA